MMQAFFIICNLSIKDDIVSIFRVTPHYNYNKESVGKKKMKKHHKANFNGQFPKPDIFLFSAIFH